MFIEDQKHKVKLDSKDTENENKGFIKSFVSVFNKKDIPQNSSNITPKTDEQQQTISSEVIPNTSKEKNDLLEKEMNENKVESMLDKMISAIEGLTQKQTNVSEIEMVAKSEFDSLSVELETLKTELETIKNEKEVSEKELSAKIESLESEKTELSSKVEAIEASEKLAKEEAKKAELLAEAKDYPGLVGTEEEIVAKLEKINAIEDEELRAEIKENLKEKSSKNIALTQEVGIESGSEIDNEELAEKELYAKAEKMASEQDITIQQAIYRISTNKA